MNEPLSGIRVVEMSVALQGPAAGLFLCDMGAEVIKVEPPIGEGSRHLRGIRNTLPPEAQGSQFIAANRGKKSLTLDANSEVGREALLRLVDTADVFLSNFRQDALDRMGLGYDILRERNPRLIYALANGFGPLGPDADRAMIDGAAAARGGLVALTGSPDGPPMPSGATSADMTGAACVSFMPTSGWLDRDQLSAMWKTAEDAWLAGPFEVDAMLGDRFVRVSDHGGGARSSDADEHRDQHSPVERAGYDCFDARVHGRTHHLHQKH